MTSKTLNTPARAGVNINVRRNRKVAPANTPAPVGGGRAEVLGRMARMARYKRAMQGVRLVAGVLETLIGVSVFVRRAMPADDSPLPDAEAVAAAFTEETSRVFPGVRLDAAAVVAAGKVAMAHAGAPAADVAARAATLEALTTAFGPAEAPLRALFPDL